MTKDEALRLAWDALQQIAHVSAMDYEYQQWAVEAITAIKKALAQPEPNYKKALEVWLNKTEWVQQTVKPHELGMHRADVLKQRVEDASPQRTWVGLTDEEVEASKPTRSNDAVVWELAVEWAEAKLKEKNT
jgi:hypothetical protein